MAKKLTFMDTPIGANKKYLVACGNEPFAGFDHLAQARIYIAMQKAKKNSSGGPAKAAEKNWEIQTR